MTDQKYKLLLDDYLNTDEIHCLKEDATDGLEPSYYIEGVFLTHSEENRNKRTYNKETILEQVQQYRETMIDKNRAVGELGHPDTPTINYERVSHKIVSLTETSGNHVIGKAKIITKNPFGQIAANLIEEDVQLGVSSRGLGKVERGNREINKYFLKAIDIVHDPSAQNAFVNAVMEDRNWFPDGTPWLFSEKLTEEIKTRISKTPSRNLAETKCEMWEKFLDGVRKNVSL